MLKAPTMCNYLEIFRWYLVKSLHQTLAIKRYRKSTEWIATHPHDGGTWNFASFVKHSGGTIFQLGAIKRIKVWRYTEVSTQRTASWQMTRTRFILPCSFSWLWKTFSVAYIISGYSTASKLHHVKCNSWIKAKLNGNSAVLLHNRLNTLVVFYWLTNYLVISVLLH